MTRAPLRAGEIVAFDGAIDLERLGAKAARLIQARDRGLRVAGGFVILADQGRRIVESLGPVLDSAGAYTAQLRAMELIASSVDMDEVAARASALAPSVVVRSSSTVEDDPLWAGAFSSYLDVRPNEVPVAVAGCWASALTTSVLSLCERTGTTPASVCPAILVQPFLSVEASGTATVSSDSTVEIVAVWGAPAPLLAGWSDGHRAVVSERDVRGPAVDGGPTGSPRAFPVAMLEEVASLARQASDDGPTVIEWAIVDGTAVLLQARSTVARQLRHATAASDHFEPAARSLSPARNPVGAGTWRDLARTVVRYGGPLGDALVLPWYLGLGAADMAAMSAAGSGDAGGVVASLGSEEVPRPAEATSAFEEACRLAAELTTMAWGSPPSQAAEQAARALAALAIGGTQERSMERGAADTGPDTTYPLPADPASGARVLHLIATVARALVAAGVVTHPEQCWSLSVNQVRELLDRPVPSRWHQHRQRTLRWQVLLRSIVTAYGDNRSGEPASPGSAVGLARRVERGADVPTVVPGEIVVVSRPRPHLAPSLWVAAGLVTESGSGAAHLIEVARSLRLPTVVGAGPLPVPDGIDVVLVDGDSGLVATLPRS